MKRTDATYEGNVRRIVLAHEITDFLQNLTGCLSMCVREPIVCLHAVGNPRKQVGIESGHADVYIRQNGLPGVKTE